ncbi:MAG: hypothetical protein HXX12_12315 [Geothrix sp.]|nr:hypothetical protein [Geothrix sp.]NWJ41741.1 hypothetical protein [Geothrix sp.]
MNAATKSRAGWFAVTLLGLVGTQLPAQSALGQLESMTGQKVQRFQGSSAYRYRQAPTAASRVVKPARLTPDQQAASLLGGVFGGLLSQALSAGPQPGSGMAHHDEQQAQIEARIQQQRQEALARDQQALQSWAQDYASQLNHQLLSLRGGNLEGQTAAQSGMWDGGTRTPGGDPLVVDLRDARALTPGNLKAAEPAPRPVTPDEVLRRRAEAQARLQRMMAENGDLKMLGKRFYELEDELSRLKAEAARLGSDGRQLAREHEAWGAAVDRAIQNSLERGTSLLTGTLIPEGTAAGLRTLQKNPRVWSGTVEALTQVNDFTDFVTERADRALAARDAVDWVQAKQSLYQNLDFIATNLQHANKAWKPLSTQWELGKSIVGSGLDVAQELDAWAYQKGAAGDQALLSQRQKAVLGKMTVLVGRLQDSRATLAAKLGVRPEDLIPVQAQPSLPRLASPVSPL